MFEKVLFLVSAIATVGGAIGVVTLNLAFLCINFGELCLELLVICSYRFQFPCDTKASIYAGGHNYF